MSERNGSSEPWYEAKGSQIPQHDNLAEEPRMIGVSGLTGGLKPTDEPPYLSPVEQESQADPTEHMPQSKVNYLRFLSNYDRVLKKTTESMRKGPGTKVVRLPRSTKQ